ncbi:TPA: hypothetical protein ACMEO3_002454 [Klebsiella pneumoniae]
MREWAQENEENLFHTKDGARRTEAFPTKFFFLQRTGRGEALFVDKWEHRNSYTADEA